MAIPAFVAGTPLTAAQLNALVADYVSKVGGVLLTDAAQTIATSSATDITWGTEVSDPDGWTAGGIATLTVPTGKGGRYIVTYTGQWSASPTTQTVTCNVAGTVYETSMGSLGIGTTWGLTLTFVRTFAAGEAFKFTATQSSGTNKDLVSRLEIAPA